LGSLNTKKVGRLYETMKRWGLRGRKDEPRKDGHWMKLGEI
jgi:hypothetical protein